MPERVTCPSCGATYRLADPKRAAGRLKCKRCGTAFSLSAGASAPPSAPTEPPSAPGPSDAPTLPQATPPESGLIGSELGGCRIERKIGQGGMGAVYRGHHLALDIPVAIKVLPSHLVENDRSFVDRFISEARAAARLQHHNIVGVLNVGEQNGQFFIIMQFVDGQSLQARLRKEGALAPAEVARIGIQVCEALKAAERHKIVHRDIKPDNIMIDTDGTVKLADMGLAKNLADDAGMTQSGVAMGTPHYMSPEQASDARRADHRTDIYALGCTLYRCLTGKVPYDGESMFTILTKHASDPVPDVLDECPDCPPALAAVIARAMAKDPAERYESAEAMQADLHRTKAGRPAAAAGAPAGSRKRSRSQGSARKKAAAAQSRRSGSLRKGLGVGAGAIAVILLIAALLPERPEPEDTPTAETQPDARETQPEGDEERPEMAADPDPSPSPVSEPPEPTPQPDAQTAPAEPSPPPPLSRQPEERTDTPAEEPMQQQPGNIKLAEWGYAAGEPRGGFRPQSMALADHTFEDGILAVRSPDDAQRAAIFYLGRGVAGDFDTTMEVRNPRACGIVHPLRHKGRFAVVLPQEMLSAGDTDAETWRVLRLSRREGKIHSSLDGRPISPKNVRGQPGANGALFLAIRPGTQLALRSFEITVSDRAPDAADEPPHWPQTPSGPRPPDRRKDTDGTRPRVLPRGPLRR